MYRHLEGDRGLNEKRSHARHTRTHRAGGVTGSCTRDSIANVLSRDLYCINDAVPIESVGNILRVPLKEE